MHYSVRVSALFSFLIFSISFAGNAIGDDGVTILEHRCVSCHELDGPAPTSLAKIWQRKGPDLFYAGSKYRSGWVEAWLQKPTRIRPTGMFYINHVTSGPKHDLVDKRSLADHMKLNEADAKAVAAVLASKRANTALVHAEKYDTDVEPGPLGELMFDKIYGCMACHRIEPDFGGVTGPEIYTAGKRLTPEFMLSYIRSPQAWDPKIWMPNKHVPDANIQTLVHYMVDLSEESSDEN